MAKDQQGCIGICRRIGDLFVAAFPFYETQNFWLSLNSFMEMKKPSEKTWLFDHVT
jgi:hypothetical protein